MAKNNLFKVRIDDNYSDGDVLTAEALNNIIRRLRDGVNYNFFDYNTLVFNDPNVEHYYGELDDEDGENGDLAGLYNLEEGTFEVYKKIDGVWSILYDDISILKLMKAQDEAADVMVGVVQLYTEYSPVNLNGIYVIDSILPSENDLILVAGNGHNTNGIYYIKSGSWVLKERVKTNQVVSISSGHNYGGAMVKKLENGTTQVVKEPERSFWKVII